MSIHRNNSAVDVDTLRAQFRELSMVEEDFKRYIVWAGENLAGVRELKQTIQKQIFKSAADLPLQRSNHSHNGPTSN